jgi:hypothetical protein
MEAKVDWFTIQGIPPKKPICCTPQKICTLEFVWRRDSLIRTQRLLGELFVLPFIFVRHCALCDYAIKYVLQEYVSFERGGSEQKRMGVLSRGTD